MDTTKFSWLTEGPVDYELKQYKMLAIISRLKKDLDKNLVWSVIEEVEEQLDRLYKTKYEIEIKDESNKIPKDIDFFNFEIIYETQENQATIDHRIVDNIVDDAIVEFGDIYMDARDKWRSIEKEIGLTWIPKKAPTLNNGFAIIRNEEVCYVYSFDKPSKMSNSWRNIKLTKHSEFDFSNDNIVKFYDDHQNDDETLMFSRIDVKVNGLDLEGAVLPIAKSILFSRLVSDFA